MNSTYFNPDRPSWPACIVDAHDLDVYESWNKLERAQAYVTAKCGNSKASWDFFGEGATPDPGTTVRRSLSKLLVTDNGHGSCTLENDNFRTIDLNQLDTGGQVVVVQDCFSGSPEFGVQDIHANGTEVNGAVNVEADAHAFGNTVFDMFVNYTGGPPLSFKLIRALQKGLPKCILEWTFNDLW